MQSEFSWMYPTPNPVSTMYMDFLSVMDKIIISACKKVHFTMTHFKARHHWEHFLTSNAFTTNMKMGVADRSLMLDPCIFVHESSGDQDDRNLFHNCYTCGACHLNGFLSAASYWLGCENDDHRGDKSICQPGRV